MVIIKRISHINVNCTGCCRYLDYLMWKTLVPKYTWNGRYHILISPNYQLYKRILNLFSYKQCVSEDFATKTATSEQLKYICSRA